MKTFCSLCFISVLLLMCNGHPVQLSPTESVGFEPPDPKLYAVDHDPEAVKNVIDNDLALHAQEVLQESVAPKAAIEEDTDFDLLKILEELEAESKEEELEYNEWNQILVKFAAEDEELNKRRRTEREAESGDDNEDNQKAFYKFIYNPNHGPGSLRDYTHTSQLSEQQLEDLLKLDPRVVESMFMGLLQGQTAMEGLYNHHPDYRALTSTTTPLPPRSWKTFSTSNNNQKGGSTSHYFHRAFNQQKNRNQAFYAQLQPYKAPGLFKEERLTRKRKRTDHRSRWMRPENSYMN